MPSARPIPVYARAMPAPVLSSRELRTRITSAGELELALVDVTLPEPAHDQVVVRVEAAPINPSDLALLVGPADLATARRDGDRMIARVPAERMVAVAVA